MRLPGQASIFDQIVEAIGRDAAIKLVEYCGGVPIYIPVRATPGSALALAIGDEAAAKFCSRFGGGYLDVPLKPEWGRLRREILSLNRDGRNSREIALALHCSRRYVDRVLAEPHRRA